ncbi:MAG: bacillithiol biosynthesis deacetylase BshB1 [Candidatus Latescibacterota bacterium]|nr:MAG: bacillithiol biosynthesis deacetylase BshB1 [Candidatus Latescibacterota bacterium]
MQERLDVIAFAPHPDDAEAACGGLLAKLAGFGYRVAICDLTRGELATNGTVAERRAEAAAASRALRLASRLNLELPDGGIRAHAEEQLGRVVALLRASQPRVIIGPHEAARHPDHLETHGLVRQAQFWCGVARRFPDLPPVQRPLLLRALDYHGMTPSFVVDISEQLDAKLQALRCYRSQFERGADSAPTLLNDPAYLERIVTNARTYGQLIGRRAGEPYAIDSAVMLDDPIAVLAPENSEVRA